MRGVVAASCGCILLKFYIKPQLFLISLKNSSGCILLKFYIKPQLHTLHFVAIAGCILLKFYIKPQRIVDTLDEKVVVSY